MIEYISFWIFWIYSTISVYLFLYFWFVISHCNTIHCFEFDFSRAWYLIYVIETFSKRQEKKRIKEWMGMDVVLLYMFMYRMIESISIVSIETWRFFVCCCCCYQATFDFLLVNIEEIDKKSYVMNVNACIMCNGYWLTRIVSENKYMCVLAKYSILSIHQIVSKSIHSILWCFLYNIFYGFFVSYMSKCILLIEKWQIEYNKIKEIYVEGKMLYIYRFKKKCKDLVVVNGVRFNKITKPTTV